MAIVITVVTTDDDMEIIFKGSKDACLPEFLASSEVMNSLRQQPNDLHTKAIS